MPTLSWKGIPPPGPNEPSGWNDNLPNALRSLIHTPESLLHTEEPALLKDYPAHLHIDILPEFHRLGLGRALIDTFSGAIKKEGADGIHLLMSQSNVEAGKFYTGTGWQRYPKVLDGGASGEQGVKDNTTWMVKEI